jgi:hypothetical protein
MPEEHKPIMLDYAVASPAESRAWSLTFTIGIAKLTATYGLTLPAIFLISTEVVVVSGAIALSIATVLLIGGLLADRRMSWFAGANGALVLGTTSVIAAFELSPDDSTLPCVALASAAMLTCGVLLAGRLAGFGWLARRLPSVTEVR